MTGHAWCTPALATASGSDFDAYKWMQQLQTGSFTRLNTPADKYTDIVRPAFTVGNNPSTYRQLKVRPHRWPSSSNRVAQRPFQGYLISTV
jgi:hypothetical protein